MIDDGQRVWMLLCGAAFDGLTRMVFGPNLHVKDYGTEFTSFHVKQLVLSTFLVCIYDFSKRL